LTVPACLSLHLGARIARFLVQLSAGLLNIQ
jgi:hypothetical protein